MTKTKKILMISGLALAASIPAGAQFFGGMIVHDPIGDISWVSTAANVITTVTKLTQQYNQAVTMATAISGTASRWQSGLTNWRLLVSSDTFGVNTGWNNSMNTGVGFLDAFNKITTPLNNAVNMTPPTLQGAAKLAIAAIERHDGLIQGNAAVIGTYASVQPKYSTSVLNLAASAVTNSAGELSYAALQQKGVSATMLQVQAANAGNELIKQQLQNDQERLIAEREAAVAAINQAAYVHANLQPNLTADLDPNGVKNLRIP